MTKAQIIRDLISQSPFIAFGSEDVRKLSQRFQSKRNIYVRFAYQWKDEHGRQRKALSLALKRTLKRLFDEVVGAFPRSKHRLNYASLRAQAGRPVLHKIVLDIVSADLLFFDLTYSNPNVLFELGIAYTTNRDLLLLLREGVADTVPSDLSGLTYCRYNTADGFSLDSYAEKDIKSMMRKVVSHKMGPRATR